MFTIVYYCLFSFFLLLLNKLYAIKLYLCKNLHNMTDSIKQLLPEREFEHFVNENEARTNMANNAENLIVAKESALEIARKLRRESSTKPSAEVKQIARDIAVSRPQQIMVVNKDASEIGTTRPQITALLKSLNVNLDIQLSRTDTQNLLATILTCNESQLNALLVDPKIPIAIKIVVKRLLEDSKVGDMSAIERVWDRIFGKNAIQVEQPQEGLPGILPNTPVSREAYILIRQKMYGSDVSDIPYESVK